MADTVLATDCDSKGVAINTGFTDYTHLTIFVFAGLASCFQPTGRDQKISFVGIGQVVPLQYKNNIFWISKNVSSRNHTKPDDDLQNMSDLCNAKYQRAYKT
ncbi:MAG: hypothetical protein U9N36_00905 [Euryarchaeota archaeon]|nr:hypothetical protein [Euryarchaeota archaeon]